MTAVWTCFPLRYRSEKSTNSMKEHLKELLMHLKDVRLRYKIAVEFNMNDIIHNLLDHPNGAYVKDSLFSLWFHSKHFFIFNCYSIGIHNESRCCIQLEVLGRDKQRQSTSVNISCPVGYQLTIFSSPWISLLGQSVLASQPSVLFTSVWPE